MNCPKCNYPVSPELLFCSECGFKIERDPLCKECGTPLKDGVLFCPVCRTPSRNKYTSSGNNSVYAQVMNKNNTENSQKDNKVRQKSSVKIFGDDDSMEKTMTIPVIKPNSHRPSDSDGKQGAERAGGNTKPSAKSRPAGGRGEKSAEGGNSTKAKTHKKTKKTGRELSGVQKNILIFMGVFLFVVFAGLVGIAGVITITHDKPVKVVQKSVEEKATKTKDVSKTTDNTDEIPGEREYGSSKQIAIYEPLIDLNYDFVLGISTKDIILPTEEEPMVNHENTDYSFVCSIPSNFVMDSSDDSEVRYVSKDKTAYIDIGALKNSKKWSIESILEATIAKLGGAVDSQPSGEGWFAVKLVKDGTYYYQKCFVNDEDIVYFEMVYPQEYSEVFDNYIDEIDSGFKKTQ